MSELDLDALDRLARTMDDDTCGVDEAASWVAGAPQWMRALIARVRTAEAGGLNGRALAMLTKTLDEAQAEIARLNAQVDTLTFQREAARAERDELAARIANALT